MQSALNYGIVFIGGGIGSALRYGVGRASIAMIGPSYPAGTLFVNIFGCVLMGTIAGWLAFRDPGMAQSAKLFLVVGVLGGFTTFSAFALDTVALWERGVTTTTVIYVLASVIGSIAALFIGLALARTSVG